MTLDEFNAFCRTLPAATHVVQWGGSQVWKIGGKVFAIGGDGPPMPNFTFKVSDIGFEVLKGLPGLRPAPYLGTGRLKWIEQHDRPGLIDAELEDYLRQSHRIGSQGLSKKRQMELGLGAS